MKKINSIALDQKNQFIVRVFKESMKWTQKGKAQNDAWAWTYGVGIDDITLKKLFG